MCGRYSITTPVEALQQAFGFPERPNLAPRYNLAPTQEAPVVRREADGKHLAMLRWGLVPFWAKDVSIGARMINARCESLAEKPAFRDAFRKRRCLVLADGFYEWTSEGGKKLPWRIGRTDGKPFAFAGLYERWHAEQPDKLETFTIVTTEANRRLKAIHDRMPVVLSAEAASAWLDPASAAPDLHDLLRPCPDDWLTAVRVSARINSVRNDDAACAAPLATTGNLL